MQINKTAKILLTTGITLLTGALFFGRKAKAASLNRYTLPAQGNSPSGTVVITNHDTVYDYKYENGRWFTRKKGAATWIDMQAALFPQAYQKAVSRLKKYIHH